MGIGNMRKYVLLQNNVHKDNVIKNFDVNSFTSNFEYYPRFRVISQNLEVITKNFINRKTLLKNMVFRLNKISHICGHIGGKPRGMENRYGKWKWKGKWNCLGKKGRWERK
jgi:hypothetical protein